LIKIEPQFIRVGKALIGKAAVIAGDTERVRYLSRFLSKPKLVSKSRFLVYTGYYKGKKLSIASHGIGMPSASIAIEELHALGAQTIIRLGTAGGISKELAYRDVVIPTSAGYTPGGTIAEYLGNISKKFAPDGKIVQKLGKRLEAEGIAPYYGSVFSSSAFYSEGHIGKGYIAVEMECAALFALGKLRKFRAGAVLVISDSISNKNMSRVLSSSEVNRRMGKVAKSVLDTASEYA